MPLDDREQKILSDIEAQLRADDPKLVRTVTTTTVSSRARRQLKVAAVCFGVGFLLLFGIVAHIAWGIVGFAIMLTSAIFGGQKLKHLGADQSPRLGGQLRDGISRYLDERHRDDR